MLLFFVILVINFGESCFVGGFNFRRFQLSLLGWVLGILGIGVVGCRVFGCCWVYGWSFVVVVCLACCSCSLGVGCWGVGCVVVVRVGVGVTLVVLGIWFFFSNTYLNSGCCSNGCMGVGVGCFFGIGRCFGLGCCFRYGGFMGFVG